MELTDTDREHIANLIKEGYREGEVRKAESAAPLLPELTVFFRPQEWHGDNAVTVSCLGPDSWQITLVDFVKHFEVDTLAQAVEAMRDAHEQRDALRNHANAPQWVKDWEGPFEVEFDECVLDELLEADPTWYILDEDGHVHGPYSYDDGAADADRIHGQLIQL